MATVTGNTLIVKPSERDPGAAMIIAELCQRAGLFALPFAKSWTFNLSKDYRPV